MKMFDRLWNFRRRDYVLPLCFIYSGLINIFFFYLGLAYMPNPIRSYGFIIGSLLFAVFFGFLFLSVMAHIKLSRLSWVLLVVVALFFGGSLLASFLKFGFHPTVVDYTTQFICFAVPMFLAGTYAAAHKSERNLLGTMEVLSLLLLPAAVIYMNIHVFNCSPFARVGYLGVIDYMSFAYTLMPALLVLMFCFAENAPAPVIPFIHRRVPHPQIVRFLFISMLWLDIIASGTRGTCVCVVCFCVLLVLVKLFFREPVKRAFCASSALALILLFTIFVYTPPGMTFVVQRMNTFLTGLSQGKIVTSTEEAPSDSQMDALIEAEGGHQLINQTPAPTDVETPVPAPTSLPTAEAPAAPSTSAPTEAAAESTTAVPAPTPTSTPEASPTPTPPAPDIASEGIQVNNRGTLYALAFREFLKAPITGMGPCGYSVKYSMYPHNVFLELLCETGLLGTIPFLAILLFIACKLIRIGKHDPSMRHLILLLSAYVVNACISGCFWFHSAMFFTLGYGIFYNSSLKTQ